MSEQLYPLKQARHRRGWSQEQAIVRFEAIGRAMGIPVPARASLRTLVSMFENGHRGVPEQYWPVLCELYRADVAELGLSHPAAAVPVPVLAAPHAGPPEGPTPEVLAYLSNILAEHVKADALIGPRYLVPTVQSQLPLIDHLCQAARGREREPVLSIGAQFAEFCGWLYQDSGNPDAAAYWTNHALDYAQELGDPQLIAYILMRKSNIVTEAGRPGHGLGLANAALKVEGNVTPRTRAVSLRQRARACALLGEQANFEQGIDEALARAATGDLASLADPARYCTPSYVTMEAGISWMQLGRPEIAVTTFEESLRKWPEHEQTRDRGLFLARFATVSAALGRVEQACEAASEAVEIARSTGSARIRAQLASVYNHLESSAKNPTVQEIRHQLAKLGSR